MTGTTLSPAAPAPCRHPARPRRGTAPDAFPLPPPGRAELATARAECGTPRRSSASCSRRRSAAATKPDGGSAASRRAAGGEDLRVLAREDSSSIPLPAQHALMTLQWVTRAENLAIAGPSGTGKSHFAEAITHKAIDATRSPGSPGITDRRPRPRRRRRHHRPGHRQDHPVRPHRDRRHRHAPRRAGRRRSPLPPRRRRLRTMVLMITSNLHPSGLDTIMPKTLAYRDPCPPPAVTTSFLTEGTSPLAR